MAGIHIHQIFYSKQTLRENDVGFLGLDNLSNLRPDWSEYWPIRHFLLNKSLNEDDYYGFFSPKFKAKTSLDAAVVHQFVDAHASEADVFLFSPCFDQGAFTINLFEQGAALHHDIKAVFQGCIEMIAPAVNLDALIMDSRNIVFCNFIVAKPKFWRVWLALCELIFEVAEKNCTTLGASLNAGTNHDGKIAPNKVFMIERVASLILSTQADWKVKAYNPLLLPFSPALISRFPRELLQLDALKIAAVSQGYPQYLSMFSQLRQTLL